MNHPKPTKVQTWSAALLLSFPIGGFMLYIATTYLNWVNSGVSNIEPIVFEMKKMNKTLNSQSIDIKIMKDEAVTSRLANIEGHREIHESVSNLGVKFDRLTYKVEATKKDCDVHITNGEHD